MVPEANSNASDLDHCIPKDKKISRCWKNQVLLLETNSGGESLAQLLPGTGLLCS